MISFKRLMIPSLLSSLIATIISFLSIKLNYFPNSPIVLFIPFIASIIGIFVYFKLIHRNEINMVRRENIVFGLMSAILWTLFTSILGTTIFVGVYNYGWSTSSIIPSLIFGFAVFTCGAFFCSIILPPIGLSLGKLPPSPPLNVPSAQKRKLLSIIIFVLVLVVPIVMFPTPHIRSVNSLIQSFPFSITMSGQTYSSYLFGGQSMQRDFSTSRSKITLGAMTFRTVIDVQSSDNVTIAVAITESYYSSSGTPISSQVHVCYNETAKVHRTSFEQAITGDDARINYVVTAKNPSPLLFPNGIFPFPTFKNGTITFSFSTNVTIPTPLTMNGSINVYWEYQYLQWTEWWRP